MSPRREAAFDAVIASTLLDGAAPSSVELDLVARSEGRLETAATPSRRAYTAAAIVLARTFRGEHAQAMALGDAELEIVDGDADADAIALLHLAVAGAYATAGWPRRAARLARSAVDYAALSGVPERLVHAHGLLTVAHALNGEFGAARESALQAHRTLDGRRTGAQAAYPLLLGEALLGWAMLDEEALNRVADDLRSIGGDDVLWRSAAALAEAMALLARDDTASAIPLLLSVLSSTAEPGVLALVRGLALSVYAEVLLARGEDRRALASLMSQQSTPSHTICFAVQRSSAFIMLGDPRAALAETEECLGLGTDHCVRTLPAVLLRRAVALEQLGRTAAADAAFDEAIVLIVEAGSRSPLLAMPFDVVDVLLARRDVRRPADRSMTDAVRSRWAGLPGLEARKAPVARLTARERQVAELLPSGATLAAIATSLHVSPNTVKTQTRAIYAKLGVRSRAEAIAALGAAGLVP